MSDLVSIHDPYGVHASGSLSDGWTIVLKHDETFGVFDRHGDIQPSGASDQGLFHDGTRFLSCLILEFSGTRPLLLSSTAETDTIPMSIDLTNHDLVIDEVSTIPQETLHLLRSKFVWGGAFYERVTVRNYGSGANRFTVNVHIGADFADIFEVRGMTRDRRGELRPPAIGVDRVRLSYQGLDGTVRTTHVTFSPAPTALTDGRASFDVHLDPLQEASFDLVVACGYDDELSSRSYDDALSALRHTTASRRAQEVEISASDERVNDCISQARADLAMLVTETEAGSYPYAGVPWFSTIFGRDGAIAALQMLWLDPSVAAGVLRYLAAHQAKEYDPAREAQPGKILHEVRRGEMAATGEIPFGLYYGSVDVTPLFVMLAGAYYRRTADRALIDSIWPNIQAALHWIDVDGDLDDDGFIEYSQHSTQGLKHQGWKDSQDSVFHSDGREPEHPIALCEVQGYVYAAKKSAADLAQVLGDDAHAAELREQATRLKRRFNDVFWLNDLGTYALALDADKQPCQVRSSNAGHCLYTGIVDEDKASRLARELMDDSMFTGWGIRTIAAGEARYNPMSYHNGSVWPHDNAIVAAGLSRYGFKADALRIMNGVYDASRYMNANRLPELFCGFARRKRVGPTIYPVACAPQAWGAGSALMLLEACLGIDIDAPSQVVRFHRAVLPDDIGEMYICDLRVGSASLNLSLRQHPDGVAVRVARRSGNVDVILIK